MRCSKKLLNAVDLAECKRLQRLEITKQWRLDNRDKLKAYAKSESRKQILKSYNASDKRKKTSAKYLQTEGGAFANKVKSYKRRAIVKKAGKFTLAEWNALKRHYGYTCLACGCIDCELTVDHVLPLAMGGSNTIDNLQPLCKSCNSSKGAKYIDYRY